MNSKYYLLLLPLITSACISSQSYDEFQVGQQKIFVEVADSPKKREIGLMNRKFLKKNHGMLFIFNDEQRLSFWMKNTLIPLSIGFFNKKCELVDMKEMVPAAPQVTHPPLYASRKAAIYALEMNKNWFKKNNIALNDKLVNKNNKYSFCR